MTRKRYKILDFTASAIKLDANTETADSRLFTKVHLSTVGIVISYTP